MSDDTPGVDRQRKIKDIFGAAIELEGDARERYVNRACGGDPGLEEEVRSWLASFAESEGFIEKPVFVAVSLIEQASPMVGRRFGNFEIIREIGSGGMGAVYLARRVDQEFEQEVALKIVRQSIAESRLIEQFRRERQILASLNHPNIAKLLDGGISEDGLPYLAMEFIEGETITDLAKRKSQSVTEKLRLFLKVCAAVEYAHRNLVVHRDIKPGNILVDSCGEPKLLDFGLAKLVDDSLSPDAVQTQTAFRALTPAYASPEQFRGGPISTASDIYSLGVVLYELLTGERPFHFEGMSMDEIIRTVTVSEPADPSRVPNSDSRLRGDLDNIVLTAIRREPERRYGSVGQFAADIERYLDGLPVSARPNTIGYRAGKFVRRHKAAVLAAITVAAVLMAAVVVSLYQAATARRQRDLANVQKLKAERINKFLQEMLSFSNQSFSSVSPVPAAKNVTVNDMLARITPQIEAELDDQPEVRGQILRTIGSSYASQGQFDLAETNFRKALRTQIETFGEDNAETAATMVELGLLSYRQNTYDEAAGLLQKALDFYRREQIRNPAGSDIKKLAYSMDTLGVVTFYRGDVKGAGSLLSEAYRLVSDAGLQGTDRTLVAFVETDYGGFLVLTGKREEGGPMLERSLAEFRQISDQPHWEVGATLMMLGTNANMNKRPAEALAYLAESESVLRATLGDMNGYLANSLHLEALVLFGTKAYSQAAEKEQNALSIRRSIFSPDAAGTLESLTTLGMILNASGKFTAAEKYIREAMAIHQAQPGILAAAQRNSALVDSLLGQRRAGEAETLAFAAYVDAKQDPGTNKEILSISTGALIRVYEREGKKTQADALRPH